LILANSLIKFDQSVEFAARMEIAAEQVLKRKEFQDRLMAEAKI
jgi:hypothetical protein